MKRKIAAVTICACALAMLMPACTVQKKPDDGGRIPVPGEYNVRFIALDRDITDPVMDRRSFYKVFINKVEMGRTTTGLESQEKTFEADLGTNRHLLTVEKWILDEKKGEYVKLNNIDQPKPNFLYFSASSERLTVITMETDRQGKARFTIELGR